jgi:hypothetical protein
MKTTADAIQTANWISPTSAWRSSFAVASASLTSSPAISRSMSCASSHPDQTAAAQRSPMTTKTIVTAWTRPRSGM